MHDDQAGVMMALSMVLTALVKNLPADVAAKALKDLRLIHRDARLQDGVNSTPVASVKSRDEVVKSYVYALKRVRGGE